MPVIDFIANLTGVQQTVAITSLSYLIVWFFQGGIFYIIRIISFWIDSSLVSIAAFLYEKSLILIEGNLFNESLINKLLTNFYIFLGLFLFFKLSSLMIKYIMDPDLVDDKKIGTEKLVQRVILGMIGIVLTPLIFSMANKFQAAIIRDGILQRLVIPSEFVENTNDLQKNAGGFLGIYTLFGFVSPSESASDVSKIKYERSLKTGKMLININDGQSFLALGNNYHYNYYPIISTVALGFLIYILLYMALDITVRFFNLFLYRILSPIAFVEYMIEGKDSSVYSKWQKGVISTYFLLFIRVISLWFFVFLIYLMGASSKVDIVKDTLLDKDNNDMIIKALIFLAVLGFGKDLPKKLSDIFGIDYEESSATGFLGKALGFGAPILGGAAALTTMGIKKLGSGALNKLDNYNKNKVDRLNKAIERDAQAGKWDLSNGNIDSRTRRNYIRAQKQRKKEDKENQIRQFVGKTRGEELTREDKKKFNSFEKEKRKAARQKINDAHVRSNLGLTDDVPITDADRKASRKIDRGKIKDAVKAKVSSIKLNDVNEAAFKILESGFNFASLAKNFTSVKAVKKIIGQTAGSLFGLSNTTKEAFDSYNQIVNIDSDAKREKKEFLKERERQQQEVEFRDSIINLASNITENLNQSIEINNQVNQRLQNLENNINNNSSFNSNQNPANNYEDNNPQNNN